MARKNGFTSLLLIGAVVVLFILLAIVIIVAGQTGNRQKSPIPSSSPEMTSQVVRTLPKLPAVKTMADREATYSFTYPAGWKKQSGPVLGGGTLVRVQPLENGGQVEYPSITIQTTPTSATYSAQVAAVFTNLRFRQSPITIDHVASTQFQGQIGNVQKVVYLFNHDNLTYLVTTASVLAQQSTQKPQLDEAIASFTIFSP